MVPVQYLHSLTVCDDSGRREFVLDASSYTIGRHSSCDIHLTNRLASRFHATLVQVQSKEGCLGYQIIDGTVEGRRSKNGTQVNNSLVQSYNLEGGEVVQFGSECYAVYFANSPDSKPPENDTPPYSDGNCPRNPYPFSPEFGAEALPDKGVSCVP